jgi:isopentenyl phosphate kinase
VKALAIFALCSSVLPSIICTSTNGIPAIGIHPLSLCLTESGRLIKLEYRPITMMVQLGMVPVLHGDVVMDTKKGTAILSGDQLLTSLARTFHFKRVGVATDVSGVLRMMR